MPTNLKKKLRLPPKKIPGGPPESRFRPSATSCKPCFSVSSLDAGTNFTPLDTAPLLGTLLVAKEYNDIVAEANSGICQYWPLVYFTFFFFFFFPRTSHVHFVCPGGKRNYTSVGVSDCRSTQPGSRPIGAILLVLMYVNALVCDVQRVQVPVLPVLANPS